MKPTYPNATCGFGEKLGIVSSTNTSNPFEMLHGGRGLPRIPSPSLGRWPDSATLASSAMRGGQKRRSKYAVPLVDMGMGQNLTTRGPQIQVHVSICEDILPEARMPTFQSWGILRATL